ncbi:unnamed protein product [Tuber melanosporum]|uniref:(Perigord truffle) hypothetical protein n=1 Tax=Tuber melanosporum (strain Mel28) TaxID=656061 RepID=D5GM58_TUBMM|nr:uncharacterized protein GSTUM_00010537001 [Tuber melanosporum]CAZ85601.1 unnamed protein product [Tuber melanosporum]
MCANDKYPTVSTVGLPNLCLRRTVVLVLAIRILRQNVRPRKRFKWKRTSQSSIITAPMGMAVRLRKSIGVGQKPSRITEKTSGNNWTHGVCAVWTPKTKFAEATTMKIVEGIGTIPVARWLQICKICEGNGGAYVECYVSHESGKYPQSSYTSGKCRSCNTFIVHVGRAHKAGWRMGLDIQPMKGSKRGQMNMFQLGTETGSVTAAIWCPEHELKRRLLQMCLARYLRRPDR